MKNILLIEDSEKHRKDAFTFLRENISFKMNLEVAYTFEEACEYLLRTSNKEISGVISDIYFPENERKNDSNQPIGVAIMSICRELNIPCILNTDGYHHAQGYGWINSLQNFLKLPEMVDNLGAPGMEGKDEVKVKAETKNWKRAFTDLWTLIGEKESV